jgi:DNA-binding transcriptional ArsR family regulator
MRPRHATHFVKIPGSAKPPPPAAVSSSAPSPSDASRVEPPVVQPAVGDPKSELSASPNLTADLRPLSSEPDLRALTAGSAPDPGRQVDGLIEAMGCPVRREILRTLCTAGRAHVRTLCEQTRVPRGTIGRHLKDLRLRGFILHQPQGKHTWYSHNPALVRLDPHPKGQLLVLIQPGGPELMLVLPREPAPPPPPPTTPRATNVAAPSTDEPARVDGSNPVD